MSIDTKLKSLRILARQNAKTIVRHIIDNNISRHEKKQKTVDLCVFCSSTTTLTKEHVIPRWTFENNPDKFFTTDINGLDQTYNKTTIPACSVCNNEILSSLELYIVNVFNKSDPKKAYFSSEEIFHIIRWLEIIDYKFQILNARRNYIKSKNNEFVPYLSDFPISVLRPQIDFSPYKAIAEIRRSQKRISTKDKTKNLNSLMVFKTSNKNFYFFHTMDEFIFIELPQFQIALFYFYKQTFSSHRAGQKAAMEIIEKAYK